MQPAPIGIRMVAGLIDLVVQIVLFIVFANLFGEASSSDGGGSASVTGGAFIALLGVILVYFMATELLLGASLGKLATGLRVVMADGSRAGAGAILVRTLLRVVDGLAGYLVAVVAVLVTGRNQRLGDLAARTLVVRA